MQSSSVSYPWKNDFATMNLRRIILIMTALLITAMAFFAWRFFETAERIHIENDAAENGFENLSSLLPGKERKKLEGEDTGRINILLLGRAGERYPGKNLTDTVIIASIDTAARKAGFLSLPRDLFVPIPETGLSTKLNSLYQHGLSRGDGADAVVSSVEHITGIDIPYFVILDFDGFEKIIDDLGGIRIFSERDILDTRYPGKNYSYETFELSAGWHTLDGKTALKYARERHCPAPQGPAVFRYEYCKSPGLHRWPSAVQCPVRPGVDAPGRIPDASAQPGSGQSAPAESTSARPAA